MTSHAGGASGAPSSADFIRQKLELLGFSQREAARQLGIDERTVRYYCAGKIPVPPAVLLALDDLQKSPQYAPAPMVLPELQAAFDAVDRSAQPLDELGLANHLHQVLTRLGRSLTVPEKRGAFAMIGALNFMSRRTYGSPVWNMYWQPLSGWTDSQGTIHHDPDVTQVSDSIIREWRERARSAQHPGLRARYSDLAWEVAKFRIATARNNTDATAPVKPDPDDARLAADSYLQAVQQKAAREIHDVGKYIGRAIELSASVGDEARLQQGKAMLLAYLDGGMADSAFPFWLFDDIAWEQRAALALTDVEKMALIVGLERALASRVDDSDPTRFDPHTATDAADRLGRWLRLQGEESKARGAAGAAGLAIEAAAEKASGLTAIALLEPQAGRYRRYGDKDAAARVERTIRRRAPEAKGELRRVSTPIEISKEEVDSWADQLAGTTFEDGLGKVVGANLIRKGQSEARVRRLAEVAVPLAHIPISIMRDDGFTSAVIGSIDKDFEGRTVHDAANAFGYSAPFLNVALARLREKHNVDVERLIGWLTQSPLFPAPRLPFMREGLSAWFIEDWIKTIHILTPQVEAALRDLVSALGGAVMRPDPDHGGFQAISFGEVLNHPRFQSQVPEDIRFHLKVLLQDSRGINLRNEFAHGLAAYELFDRGIANWVVHAVILLGLIRLGADSRSGGRP